jgi:hypothetical protein
VGGTPAPYAFVLVEMRKLRHFELGAFGDRPLEKLVKQKGFEPVRKARKPK